jgi:hypothetical protein
MPWWLPLYFILISFMTALWLRDEIKDQENHWYMAAELAAILALGACGLAYWFPSVKQALGSAARWMFSASVGCILLTTVRDFRSSSPTEGLSPLGQLAAHVLGVAIYLLIYGPIVYWGFVSAFGWQHNGA